MVCELGLTGLPSLPSGSYFVPGVKLMVVPLLKHDLKDAILHFTINGAVCLLYPVADLLYGVIREVCDVLTHSCFPVQGHDGGIRVSVSPLLEKGGVVDLPWHVLDLIPNGHCSVVVN